jgi:hypothetical protein
VAARPAAAKPTGKRRKLTVVPARADKGHSHPKPGSMMTSRRCMGQDDQDHRSVFLGAGRQTAA